MKLNQKKGVSGVVTAVLLILLVIAAIAILWVVIQNFVEQGTANLEGSADCFETDFEVVSANSTSDVVTVRRTGGEAALDATNGVTIAVGAGSGPGSPSSPSVSQSSTATIAPGFGAVSIDVSVGVTLADGTACPIINAGSITAS